MSCSRSRTSRWRHLQLVTISFLVAGSAMARPDQPASDSPATGGDGSPARIVTVSWPEIVGVVDQHPAVAAGRFMVEAARGAASAAAAVPNPTLEATVGQGRAVDGDDSRQRVGPRPERAPRLDRPTRIEGRSGRGRGRRRRGREPDAAARRAARAADPVLEPGVRAGPGGVARGTRGADRGAGEHGPQAGREGRGSPGRRAPRRDRAREGRSELEAARTSLAARQAQLALWLGVPAGTTVVAAADLSALPAAMDLDTALAKLRASHPALAGRQGVESAHSKPRSSTEKRARLPAFSLTAFTTHELDRRRLRRRSRPSTCRSGTGTRGRIAQAAGRARGGPKAGRGDRARARVRGHRGAGRVPRVGLRPRRASAAPWCRAPRPRRPRWRGRTSSARRACSR